MFLSVTNGHENEVDEALFYRWNSGMQGRFSGLLPIKRAERRIFLLGRDGFDGEDGFEFRHGSCSRIMTANAASYIPTCLGLAQVISASYFGLKQVIHISLLSRLFFLPAYLMINQKLSIYTPYTRFTALQLAPIP